eukprot:TRINITY_DN59698_c0_g1_i4.p1 TRINITY_DN59698_c0_g1~~TRINITY_DN59698_c0_g1_i4.p1  ORF type:complete len:255 (-),score=14.42 TRINITY_DN59698_c0_g1_i4:408-1172(-)
MGKKYVVMIDGSVHSTKAATLCAKLCKKGDEVHLYTSIPRISYHIPKSQHVHGHHTWLQDAAKLFAGKELSELKLKMDVVTDVRADLVDFAKARKPDTVFMGSRGLGEFKGVWGSASQYVLHHYEEGSICVVRDYDVAAHAADGGNKPLHFLLAADGSEHSKRAIAHLGQVATPEDAVTTFAALDSPPQVCVRPVRHSRTSPVHLFNSLSNSLFSSTLCCRLWQPKLWLYNGRTTKCTKLNWRQRKRKLKRLPI